MMTTRCEALLVNIFVILNAQNVSNNELCLKNDLNYSELRCTAVQYIE